MRAGAGLSGKGEACLARRTATARQGILRSLTTVLCASPAHGQDMSCPYKYHPLCPTSGLDEPAAIPPLGSSSLLMRSGVALSPGRGTPRPQGDGRTLVLQAAGAFRLQRRLPSLTDGWDMSRPCNEPVPTHGAVSDPL